MTKRGFSPSGIRPGACYSSSSPSDKATRFDSSRHAGRRRPNESYMKNKKDEKPESDLEEFEHVVTQEDYEEGLKRGWTDNDMLKPGRYKVRRGGFLARHPELKIKDKRTA